MRAFVLCMLLFGVLLLGGVLYSTDLSEVGRSLGQIGLFGALAIIAVHALGYVSLAASWAFAIPGASLAPRPLASLWKILMVGTALDTVTPFGGLGGEPVKALLLKRDLGVPYTDAVASLVITRMTDLVAQVVFIAIGFALALQADFFEAQLQAAAGAGFALFISAVFCFGVAQQLRGFSRLRSWLQTGRYRQSALALRVASSLDAVVKVEDQLLHFYSAERGRFTLSVAAAFGDWVSGAVGVYVAMQLLGHPVSASDALVIEAFVIAVRSTFFFVPADLGTQEVAHLLIVTAVTGSPELGVALAAVRRGKDLLWVGWGLAIGWRSQLVGGSGRVPSESSVS